MHPYLAEANAVHSICNSFLIIGLEKSNIFRSVMPFIIIHMFITQYLIITRVHNTVLRGYVFSEHLSFYFPNDFLIHSHNIIYNYIIIYEVYLCT